MSEQTTNSKMPLILAGLAIVIAAVAYFGTRQSVPADQAAGTVAPPFQCAATVDPRGRGAATRGGEQITADDVQLGDQAVAQLMQTDLYQKIVTDAEFASALQNDSFQALLSNDALRSALGSGDLRNALSNGDMRQSLASGDLASVMANGDLRLALANDDLFQQTFLRQSRRIWHRQCRAEHGGGNRR